MLVPSSPVKRCWELPEIHLIEPQITTIAGHTADGLKPFIVNTKTQNSSPYPNLRDGCERAEVLEFPHTASTVRTREADIPHGSPALRRNTKPTPASAMSVSSLFSWDAGFQQGPSASAGVLKYRNGFTANLVSCDVVQAASVTIDTRLHKLGEATRLVLVILDMLAGL